jgi:hypothetical protein
MKRENKASKEKMILKDKKLHDYTEYWLLLL